MPQAPVTARIKVKGKHFEINVFLENALKIKQGKSDDLLAALDCQAIYSDIKKGVKVPEKDLIDAFGTKDFQTVAKQIIVKGEVQKTQEFRDAEREAREKQVIDMILRNAVDQHGHPYTEERLRRAISETHFNFEKRPVEQLMHELVEKLKTIIPISIEMKKIKLVIPARYTGQAYSIIKDLKESEEWLANGNLQVIINIASGLQIDFYEKLNNVTHGSVQSEEILEKK